MQHIALIIIMILSVRPAEGFFFLACVYLVCGDVENLAAVIEES